MGGLVRIIAAAGRSVGSVFTTLIAGARTLGSGIKNMKVGLSSFSRISQGLGKMNFALPSLGKMQDTLMMVKELAASIVMPGFNYAKDIESSKQGIAGILQSMTTLNGQTLSFQEAMGISDDIMKKLEKDALRTSATTEELAASFTSLLAPGLKAGLKIDEIEQLSTKGVLAGKSVGLTPNEMTKELQGMLAGNVQGSKLAEIMGITPEAIEAAKQSSEGLFTYLQEHLQKFDDVTANYPETLAGKLSKLEEVSLIASSKFTEAFEPEIKECLDLVTDMIGQVNEQTSELEINPLILDFIADLKAGWQELTSYIDDALPGNSAVVEDLTDTVGSLYRSFCNVCVALFDFGRIIANSALVEIYANVVSKAAEAVEWLTGGLRDFLDTAVKVTGLKRTDTSSVKEMAKGTMQGFENIFRMTPNIVKNGLDNTTGQSEETAKQEARQMQREEEAARRAAEQVERERLRSAQEAMKAMLQYWKDALSEIQRAFKESQDALKFQFEQDGISSDEYHARKIENEIDYQQQESDNLAQRIKGIEETAFGSESKRQENLTPLLAEKAYADKERERLLAARNEMLDAIDEIKTTGKLPDNRLFQSREAYEAVKAHRKELEPAKQIRTKGHELAGDISSDKIEAVRESYKNMRDRLSQQTGDKTAQEALALIDAVEADEIAKINFEQVKKKLATANTVFAEGQKEIIDGVIDGTKSISEADSQHAKLVKKMYSDSIKELEKILESPNISEETAGIIRSELKKIQQTIDSGFAKILQGIDEKLRQDIAKISANPNLTKMQKDMAVEDANRAANRKKAEETQREIDDLKLRPINKENLGKINELEEQREMFKKMAELPAVFDKINQASRQALEDGLYNFFASGINQCKSLGEAFQNLGKSILQSMQQVLADQLTRQFMRMLMPKFAGGGAVGEIQHNAAGGRIIGPGTGTSDSILSWLSTGEYVIKAASVKRFGTKFLDHINNGMMPPEVYQLKLQSAMGNFMGQGAAAYATTNSVNVPVNVNGFNNPTMASELRNNIEDTVVKIMRKYS